MARSLAPPAGPEQLAQLLAAPWCPRSVHESYAAHDGARKAGGVLALIPQVEGAGWSRACRWMPIAEALEERERLTGFFPEARARWVPIGRVGRFRSRDPYEAEDQQVVVIDAIGEELLAVCYHEYAGPVGQASRLSIGWSKYLDHLTERLESGSLEASTDTYGVLRLDAAARPPIAPVGRRPDPAEALVAALVAKDLLRLRSGPAEELLEKVRRALRKRGAAARAASLVAIFSELDVVEDFFISEDDLAALLEQF